MKPKRKNINVYFSFGHFGRRLRTVVCCNSSRQTSQAKRHVKLLLCPHFTKFVNLGQVIATLKPKKKYENNPKRQPRMRNKIRLKRIVKNLLHPFRGNLKKMKEDDHKLKKTDTLRTICGFM